MKTKKTQLSISSSLYEVIDEPPPFSVPSERLQKLTEPSLELNYTGFAVSDNSLSFRDRNFPGVSLAEWTDWKWQIRNSYTSFNKLEKIINLSEDEKGFKEQIIKPYPFASRHIMQVYLMLMIHYNRCAKTMVPVFKRVSCITG